jgi:hypothetical protein
MGDNYQRFLTRFLPRLLRSGRGLFLTTHFFFGRVFANTSVSGFHYSFARFIAAIIFCRMVSCSPSAPSVSTSYAFWFSSRSF